jgi:hypothetical protein
MLGSLGEADQDEERRLGEAAEVVGGSVGAQDEPPLPRADIA